MHVHIPIVDRFVKYLADERHFSPYTGRCYAMDLSQYTDFLAASAKITVDMGAEKDALESRKADVKGRTLTSRILGRPERKEIFAGHHGAQNCNAAFLS